MTKFLDKSFSVSSINSQQYRDNHDAIFRCQSEIDGHRCDLKRGHSEGHQCQINEHTILVEGCQVTHHGNRCQKKLNHDGECWNLDWETDEEMSERLYISGVKITDP